MEKKAEEPEEEKNCEEAQEQICNDFEHIFEKSGGDHDEPYTPDAPIGQELLGWLLSECRQIPTNTLPKDESGADDILAVLSEGSKTVSADAVSKDAFDDFFEHKLDKPDPVADRNIESKLGISFVETCEIDAKDDAHALTPVTVPALSESVCELQTISFGDSIAEVPFSWFVNDGTPPSLEAQEQEGEGENWIQRKSRRFGDVLVPPLRALMSPSNGFLADGKNSTRLGAKRKYDGL